MTGNTSTLPDDPRGTKPQICSVLSVVVDVSRSIPGWPALSPRAKSVTTYLKVHLGMSLSMGMQTFAEPDLRPCIVKPLPISCPTTCPWLLMISKSLHDVPAPATRRCDSKMRNDHAGVAWTSTWTLSLPFLTEPAMTAAVMVTEPTAVLIVFSLSLRKTVCNATVLVMTLPTTLRHLSEARSALQAHATCSRMSYKGSM
mmetsp:Transcript_37363/g.54822  ORF Transcript_37363/g.54822 Transcript_37363/m.54822 type:complete len:200 (+) Transcript_37363:1218-1817(+)